MPNKGDPLEARSAHLAVQYSGVVPAASPQAQKQCTFAVRSAVKRGHKTQGPRHRLRWGDAGGSGVGAQSLRQKRSGPGRLASPMRSP